MSSHPTRREFVGLTGGLLGAALLPDLASPWRPEHRSSAGTTVLFQGDSITDVGRNRTATAPNAGNALGGGYPLLVASAALKAHPDAGLRFFNRGVSGDKIPDLQARWDADTLALKPDVLSVLVGVNDLWHKLNGKYAGTVAEYESGYTSLLESTRTTLPNVKLLVLEPFVLRTGAVNDQWFPEFDERRAAAKRVAGRVGATFVPLQPMFDELARTAPPDYWLGDGVHPTAAGHAAIAETWRAAAGL
jgi:lysophospholipase L1-like esterase